MNDRAASPGLSSLLGWLGCLLALAILVGGAIGLVSFIAFLAGVRP